jgi:uncharacterized protein YkwD
MKTRLRPARTFGLPALPLAVALGLVLASAGASGPARAQGSAPADPAAYAEPVLTARLLELVNRARAEARDCGPKRYEAAAPLRRQRQLDAAARAHANDLAAKGEFDLRGSDGSTTETRVEREGYRWSGIGENLADRHFTPEPIVEGWLQDPMQCSNIMHPAFTEAGLARSPWEPGSRASIVWSMVVARPRAQPR